MLKLFRPYKTRLIDYTNKMRAIKKLKEKELDEDKYIRKMRLYLRTSSPLTAVQCETQEQEQNLFELKSILDMMFELIRD